MDLTFIDDYLSDLLSIPSFTRFYWTLLFSSPSGSCMDSQIGYYMCHILSFNCVSDSYQKCKSVNVNIGQNEYNIWQIECYIYYIGFNNSTFSGIWIGHKDNFFSSVLEENSCKH
jgi:hypothetical protein